MKKVFCTIALLVISLFGITQTYTFIGDGLWTDASNWANNNMPPPTLPPGSQIVVNPAGAGVCFLNIFQVVANGAYLTVLSGKRFVTSDFLVTANFPLASTGIATNISNASATLIGSLLSEGGSPATRGICFALHPTPTLLDTVIQSGSGTGSYSADIMNLMKNTTYYYVAYARNSIGVSYGTSLSFTTQADTIPSFPCGTSIVVNHKLSDSAAVAKTVTYGTVMAAVGGNTGCWITKNLGADQQPSSYNDNTEASAGWYWQFNRKQGYKFEGTTRTPNSSWLTVNPPNTDWLQKSDPCTILGGGWRIPTYGEWNELALNWFSSSDAFQSPLKLHAGGTLNNSTGVLSGRGGTNGLFWSSLRATTNNGYAALITSLQFPSMTAPTKQAGLSLRCVKQNSWDALSELTTILPTLVTSSSATTGGRITYDPGIPIIARGICFGNSPGPTISNQTVSGGIGNGEFAVLLSGLLPNNKYYAKAYATNNTGTAYGAEIVFTTTLQLPVVSFNGALTPVSSGNGISVSGSVRNDGGNSVTASGFVYGTNSQPTLADSVRPNIGNLSPFSILINALMPETRYYIRPYATNSVGTGYGETIAYVSPPGPCLSGDTIIRFHEIGNVAPESKTIIYQTRQSNLSGESKCWIIQNLGAEARANAVNDPSESAAGWYWQFGQKQGFGYKWGGRMPNSASWVSGYLLGNWDPEKDPCRILLREGWRIPTKAELTNVYNTSNWLSMLDAYNSSLKLHYGGYISKEDKLEGRGNAGLFWSSYQDNLNPVGDLTFCLFGYNNTNLLFDTKSMFSGGSIRCLKD